MSEYKVRWRDAGPGTERRWYVTGLQTEVSTLAQSDAERIARALRLLDQMEQDEPEPQCEKGVGHWFGPGCDTCQCGQLRERAPWVEPQP